MDLIERIDRILKEKKLDQFERMRFLQLQQRLRKNTGNQILEEEVKRMLEELEIPDSEFVVKLSVFTLDMSRDTLYVEGSQNINLISNETMLLGLLLKNPERDIKLKEIIQHCDMDGVEYKDNKARLIVENLREKLADLKDIIEIETVRTVGYRLKIHDR